MAPPAGGHAGTPENPASLVTRGAPSGTPGRPNTSIRELPDANIAGSTNGAQKYFLLLVTYCYQDDFSIASSWYQQLYQRISRSFPRNFKDLLRTSSNLNIHAQITRCGRSFRARQWPSQGIHLGLCNVPTLALRVRGYSSTGSIIAQKTTPSTSTPLCAKRMTVGEDEQ